MGVVEPKIQLEGVVEPRKINFSPLNMIAVASSLLWKFQTPLRQNATHLFVLLADGAYIDIF